MAMVEMNKESLAALGVDGEEITRVDVSAVAVLNRSEVEAQIDAAHRHPRSIKAFLSEATALATITREIAESCIYTLPRGGKALTGPSVRLAEICASAYGNMHFGARVVDVEEKTVVAQGVAWDIQKNVRVTIETKRRITGKNGKRYDDDMITVTGNAACSIGLRNAIFRVIPRSYVMMVYAEARKVSVGDARTFADRRADVMGRLGKMGVPIERVLARVERAAVEDVTMEDLEALIGLGTAIKNEDATIDEAFPVGGKDGDAAPKTDSAAARVRAARSAKQDAGGAPANGNAPATSSAATSSRTTSSSEAARSSPPPRGETDGEPPEGVRTAEWDDGNPAPTNTGPAAGASKIVMEYVESINKAATKTRLTQIAAMAREQLNGEELEAVQAHITRRDTELAPR